MVYMTIRDAFDIEKHLMGVCPEWHKASEYYLAFLISRPFFARVFALWCEV